MAWGFRRGKTSDAPAAQEAAAKTVSSKAWKWIGAIGVGLVALVSGWIWLLDRFATGALNQVISLVGAVVLLFLVPRYLHLLRIAFEAAFGAGGHIATHLAPLPSQRKVVDALKRASIGRSDLAANIIALRGGWGAGKSACMQRFREEMVEASAKDQSRAALVWFDCWRHQTDTLPEMSLYWQVASTYSLLWPWGWLFVPALRLYLSRIPLVLKAEWKVGGGAIAFDSNSFKELPKALFWQHRLELLVRSALRAGNRRVVIVLEDIDRCAPQSAQVFVTLIRRFLAVPGVSVVVPYVDEQLSAKVFNPLGRQLPDLAGTTQALLWREFGESILEKRGEEPPLFAELFDKVQTRLLDSGELGAKAEEQPRSPPELIQAWMSAQMVREYLRASPVQRRRFDNLLSDKYLSDTIEVVPWLTAEDCVELVRRRSEESTLLTSQVPAFEQALGWLEGRLREAKFANPAQWPRVSARQFNAALEQVFNSISDGQVATLKGKCERARDGVLEPGWLLLWWMVLLAFEYACERTCQRQNG